jgi:hypothetical protein
VLDILKIQRAAEQTEADEPEQYEETAFATQHGGIVHE